MSFGYRHQAKTNNIRLDVVHERRPPGPGGGKHRLAERHGFHQAKPKTLCTVQAYEYVARFIELKYFVVSKNALDQRHPISEARDLTAQLRERVTAPAARLRVIHLDHQVSGIVGRKGAPKCPDCGERIVSCGSACGFENANKDDRVDGKAGPGAIGMDSAEIRQCRLRVNGRRSPSL